MHVEFRVLGPLELRRGGDPVSLRGAKLRLLLADLLVNHGEVVAVDRLIEDLWPSGAPQGARHAIETHVWKLRATLGEAALLSARPPGYVLEVDSRSIDAVRFEQLLAEARDAQQADPARAATRASEALALWRGGAFADVAYESFAQAEIARLEELRLEAEEERVEAELALGKASELVGELEALVAAAPLRERRSAQLMLALYRAGRHPDALTMFRDTRERLLEELGLEPSDELRSLHRRILQQDPGLAAGARPASTPRVSRRLATVVAVEPEISLELDPEVHDRKTRDAAAAVDLVAAEYGAQQPEPFVLVFPHENQWERATAAAAAIHEGLGARVGLATGEALLREGFVGGPLVARARAHAREGGVAELPVHALQERVETPFVGRRRELERLRAARAMLVVGPPGIGKSRLARELAHERLAVSGRCSAYGAQSLAPLHEIALALGSPDALAETWAAEVPLTFRRLCESIEEPLLVVFDDVQWADAVVLETIEHLVAQGPERTRVVCLARDELLEDRPDFLPRVERLVLDPLPIDEAETLARHVADLAPEVRDRALAAAEGNPLFIEQLLAHAAEGADSLPHTLRALLAARLDRLAPSERAAIEHGAVIGREFDASLLTELFDAGTAREPLASLVRRGLLDQAASTTPFQERFRFRHALIHEVAYGTSPRAERSQLHERLADTLDRQGGSDELVGFHLEQAAHLRATDDRHARQLAHEAGRRLGAAGMASWSLGYLASTSGLLLRATGLLDEADPGRRELLCELGVVLATAGETAAADAALGKARDLATRHRDRRIELRALVEQAAADLLGRADSDPARLLEAADVALPHFETIGDERGLGRTLMLSGWVLGGMYLQHEAWADRARRALVHYRNAGLPSSTCVAQIAAAAFFGPLPASAGIALCRDLLQREVEDRVGEASVLAHLGGLEAMQEDFVQAASHLQSARDTYAELGRGTALVRTCAPLEAYVAQLRGDLDAAHGVLLESCSILRETENWNHFGTQAAALTEVLCRLGRAGEAAEWLEIAERNALRSDLNARISLATARAAVLLARDENAPAERRARQAVRLARDTDGLNHHAAALTALGDALRSSQRLAPAAAAFAQARALYERKENAAAAARLSAAATA